MLDDFYPIHAITESEDGVPVLTHYQTLNEWGNRQEKLLMSEWWENPQLNLAEVGLTAYKLMHQFPLSDEERQQAANTLWSVARGDLRSYEEFRGEMRR